MMPIPGADPKSAPPMLFSTDYGDPRKTPLAIEVVENPSPDAYDLKLRK
jgi:hypothetical protein